MPNHESAKAGVGPNSPYSQAGAEARFDEAVLGLARIGARVVEVAGSTTGTIDARFETVVALDNQARTLLARLHNSRILAVAPAPRIAAMLAAVREFFGIALDAYERCLYSLQCDTAVAARLSRIQDCRLKLVRAGGDRVLWELCSGGPAHPHLWSWLGAVFTAGDFAEDGGTSHSTPATPRSGQREYLRAVAAQTASLDLLPPRAALVADRVLAFVLPMLDFRAHPFAGATHFVRPDQGSRPSRLVHVPERLEGLWFFSARIAVGALHELRASLDAGVVPLTLAPREGGAALLRTVTDHLIHQWSETPPVRRFRRHSLDGSLSAVQGIDDLQSLFAGRSSVREVEWSLKDVSRGGLGAYVSGEAAPGVRMGQLVGVRANGGVPWHLAVVRRTWIGAGESPFVGLETLSQQPMLAHVDDGHASADVILCDPILKGEALRIAARSDQLNMDAPLFVTGRGRVQKLKPLHGLMAGDGFELRAYQAL